METAWQSSNTSTHQFLNGVYRRILPGWQKDLIANDSDSDDGLDLENRERLVTETIDQLIARLKETNVPAQNPTHLKPSEDSVREYYQWLTDIGTQNTVENCLLTSLTTEYAKNNLGSLRLFVKKTWSRENVFEYINKCTESDKEKDLVASKIACIEMDKKSKNPVVRLAYVKWKNEDIMLAGKAYALLKANHRASRGILQLPKYDNRKTVDWDANDRPIYINKYSYKRPGTYSVPAQPLPVVPEEQRLQFRRRLERILRWPFEKREMDIDNIFTFGLHPQLINYLSLAVPLTPVVIVKNPNGNDGDNTELIELFSRAGTILYTQWTAKTARLQYDHPLEAVQAISMFHMEKIDGHVWEARMGKNKKNILETLVPPKFGTIGPGIGPNGVAIRNIRSRNHIYYANAGLKTELKKLREKFTEVTNILDNITKESQQMVNNSEQEPVQKDFQNQISDLATVITSSIQNSLMGVSPLMQGLMRQIPNPHMISPNWTNVQPVQAAISIPQAVTAAAAPTISLPQMSTVPTIQPCSPNIYTANIRPADISYTTTQPTEKKPNNNRPLENPFTPVVSTNLDIPPPKSRFDAPPANLKHISQSIAKSVTLEGFMAKRVYRFDGKPVSPPRDFSQPEAPFITPSLHPVNSFPPEAEIIGVDPTITEPQSVSQNPHLISMPGASKPPEIKINIPSLQPTPSSSFDSESIPVSNPRKTNELDSRQLAAKSSFKRDSESSPPKKISKRDKYLSTKIRNSLARRDKKKYMQDNVKDIRNEDIRGRDTDLFYIGEDSSPHSINEEYTKLHSTVNFKYLPPSVGTEELREKMGEIGTILDVMKTGPGEYMVCFLHARSAETCIEMYHQSKVDDQTIEAVLAN